MTEKEIHIYWEGPLSYKKAVEDFDDSKTHIGLYQIYGTHAVYGINTLLYIGKADKQTLSKRISDHKQWFEEHWFPHARKVYVGLWEGEKTPSRKVWMKEITQAERLLILSHCPSMNSSGLNVKIRKKNEEYGIHVINWGRCGLLLPEISGQRFSYSDKGEDNFVKNYSSKR